MKVVPVIADIGLTVNTCDAVHPDPVVAYVTTDVPGDTPFTVPLVEPIVTVLLLTLHVPPVVASASVVEEVPQIANVPVIDATTGFTVTAVVYTVPELQPEPVLLTVNE